MKRLTLLAGLALSVVACGGDESSTDAPVGPTIDGPAVDADPNAPDADLRPDADPTLPDAPTMPGIACGAETCDPMNQDCCITIDPGGGPPTFACGDQGNCAGASLSCDGPEDCEGGDVCCARGDGGGGGTSACQASCNGPTAVVLCHTEADCETGEMCCPSPLGISGCLAVTTCPL